MFVFINLNGDYLKHQFFFFGNKYLYILKITFEFDDDNTLEWECQPLKYPFKDFIKEFTSFKIIGG